MSAKNERSYAHISIGLAVVIFPVTYVLSKVFGYILKSWNPSAVNVQSDLAYLAPIIYFGLAVFAVLAILALTTSIKALRSPQRNLAVLSIVLTLVEVILLAALLLIRL